MRGMRGTSGAHSFIGQVETDTEELYTNKGDFPVINNMKKAKKKKYRDSGAPSPLLATSAVLLYKGRGAVQLTLTLW